MIATRLYIYYFLYGKISNCKLFGDEASRNLLRLTLQKGHKVFYHILSYFNPIVWGAYGSVCATKFNPPPPAALHKIPTTTAINFKFDMNNH